MKIPVTLFNEIWMESHWIDSDANRNQLAKPLLNQSVLQELHFKGNFWEKIKVDKRSRDCKGPNPGENTEFVRKLMPYMISR